MMSARAGFSPATLHRFSSDSYGQVGHQVANLCPRHAEAPHRLAGLTLAAP